MRRHRLSIVVLSLAAMLLLSWPSQAEAQRRGRRRVSTRAVVIVGGFNYPVYRYGPYYAQRWGPYGPYAPYGHGYGYGFREASASIRIDVQPEDAEVYVDGYFAGYVDEFDGVFQSMNLEPGGHEIVVYHEGYRSLVHQIYVRPYAGHKIKENLVPLGPGETPEARPTPADVRDYPDELPAAPQARGGGLSEPQVERRTIVENVRFGSISLLVRPADAEIVIDGEVWDRDPDEVRLNVRLSEGRHTIEVRKDGYVTYREDVRIQDGRQLPLNVSLRQR